MEGPVTEYTYLAHDASGAPYSGTVEAASLEEATTMLHVQMKHPIRVAARRADGPCPAEGGAFALFNQGLSELTELRIPLPAALRELSSRLRGSRLQQSLRRIEGSVREGRSLEQALEPEASAFPPYYVALVRAGVAAGNLPAVLGAVAFDAARLRGLERAVVRATLYPVAIVMMVAGVISAYLNGYVPAIKTLFSAAHLPLPWLLANEFALALLLWTPVLIVLGAGLGLFALRGLSRSSRRAEQALWTLPFFGPMSRRLAEARFLTALRLLTEARVPLTHAVPLALRAAGSRVMARQIPAVESSLREGSSLSCALAGALPAASGRYLRWGEETGRLAACLEDLRAMAAEEAEEGSRTIQALAEPAGTLVVGAMVVALFVPMVTPYIELIRNLVGSAGS